MRYERIAQVLLVICAIAVPTAGVLAVYVIRNAGMTAFLQSSLISQNELQKRLLANISSDMCLTPHALDEISYVLNPGLDQCTLWVDPNEPYRVNSLGLRGPEMPPKPSGVRRILVVGDSWVWGWRLRDPQTLAARLEAFVNRKLRALVTDGAKVDRDRIAYQFVTAAMPGWNTRSQVAFLETHFAVLAPDYVLWNVSQNDVDDLMGVVPPGAGSNALSSQVVGARTSDRAPLVGFARSWEWPASPALFWWSTTPAPLLLGRWRDNFARIRDLAEQREVPVIGFLVGLDPAFVALIEKGVEFPGPKIFDARNLISDERWGFAKEDWHPTAWAVETMVPAIVAQMVAFGWLPELAFSTEEQALVAAWPTSVDLHISNTDIDRYIAAFIERVPKAYESDATPDPMFPGLTEGDGIMASRGVVFLSTERGQHHLEIDLALDPSLVSSGVTVDIRIASADGKREVTESFALRESPTKLRVNLPDQAGGLVEMRWEFDRVVCNGPLRCHAARLYRIQPG